jgi:chromosome segregation ATPase
VAGIERARREAEGAYAAAETRVAKRTAARAEASATLQVAEREVADAEERLQAAMGGWEQGLAALRSVEASLAKDKSTAASIMATIAQHGDRLSDAEAAAVAAREHARKAREAFPLGASLPRW